MTLEELITIIEDRKKKKPEESYVSSLFEKGIDRIVQKVGEEAVEVVIAAKNDNKAQLIEESSDLLFHLLIALTARGVTLNDIYSKLSERHQKKH